MRTMSFLWIGVIAAVAAGAGPATKPGTRPAGAAAAAAAEDLSTPTKAAYAFARAMEVVRYLRTSFKLFERTYSRVTEGNSCVWGALAPRLGQTSGQDNADDGAAIGLRSV